jgi:hypothetical protein
MLRVFHGNEPSGYVWRLRIPFNEEDGFRNYLSKFQRYDRLLDARNDAPWKKWTRDSQLRRIEI